MRIHSAQLLGWVSLFSAARGLLVNESQYLISCYKAKNTYFNSSSGLCSHVTWGSANLFPRASYTPYDYGQPLSPEAQSQLALAAYSSLLPLTDGNADCMDALRWFTCADAFPYCPVAGISSSAVSSLPVCRFHCHQVQSLCDFPELDCSSFQTGNCMTYLPTGYFLLPPDQGPYDTIPTLYLATLSLWAFFFVAWIFQLLLYCREKARPPPVLAMGSIYAARLIYGCGAYFFWLDCSAYLGMCSFENTYTAMAGLQAMEAIEYMMVVYVARNLAVITKLSFQEISAAWFPDVIFFVISFALRAVILRAPSTYWIVMISLLYFFVFYTIISVTSHEWLRMKAQLQRITETMPVHVVEQLFYRCKLHGYLLIIAWSLLIVEIICQCMFALNVPIQTLLIFYEVTQLILIGGMGILFRPKKWSPFFFMEPSISPIVPNEERALAVVNVVGSKPGVPGQDEVPTAIELAPLLASRERYRSNRQYVSMLVQPDGQLQLGL